MAWLGRVRQPSLVSGKWRVLAASPLLDEGWHPCCVCASCCQGRVLKKGRASGGAPWEIDVHIDLLVMKYFSPNPTLQCESMLDLAWPHALTDA
jgi:hypothetical protein